MSDEHKMGHLQDFKVYAGVLAALMFLTLVTVGASEINFGSELISNIVAVVIATIKAALVTSVFMHGRFESKITWAFIYYPVILLLLLLGALFLDYGFRDEHDIAFTPQSITGSSHAGEAGGHETPDH